ncbi:hypothetical protein WDZ17_14220 [Pseudokineococcus basanitobsidens]|uniref:Antitoxin protein of toxin-antitoxin system n=1 Tax=Pseudokineococcus basanitobsidens TaxID=1926649 RepID=A0ABU8RMY0_9ACTN
MSQSSAGSSAHRADEPYDRTTTAGGDGSSTGGGSSTKDQAQQRAGEVAGSTKQAGREVAGSAKDAGREVAGTAKDKAGDVGQEAKTQAKDLYAEGKEQLSQHAGEQQKRAAQGLSSVSGELRAMVDGSDEQGPVTDLARQAADRVDAAASWLGDREPSGLLDDVRSFAGRRPGAFLALAAGAGLLAGRLARGLKDASSDDTGSSGSTGRTGTSTGTSTTTGTMSRGYGTAEVPPTTGGTPLAEGTSAEPLRGRDGL